MCPTWGCSWEWYVVPGGVVPTMCVLPGGVVGSGSCVLPGGVVRSGTCTYLGV